MPTDAEPKGDAELSIPVRSGSWNRILETAQTQTQFIRISRTRTQLSSPSMRICVSNSPSPRAVLEGRLTS